MRDYTSTQETKKYSTRLEFVPQSSPPDAVLALAEIERHPGVARSEIEARFGRNEIRDLRALKLITQKGGHLYPVGRPLDGLTEIGLKRAVGQMPSIRATISVLTQNPGASSAMISDAVALELGVNGRYHQLKHGMAKPFVVGQYGSHRILSIPRPETPRGFWLPHLQRKASEGVSADLQKRTRSCLESITRTA